MSTIDSKALFNIGYGLYAVTCNDAKKDNALIVNTVCQLTSNPLKVAVTINKSNYSHNVIKKTGKMNVNCLSEDAPFEIFKKLGFSSGRDTNKFENLSAWRSDNGLYNLSEHVNSYFSLTVSQYIDVGTHGMFICIVDDAKVITNIPTMTYNYYQANVKPKPQVQTNKGFICKICSYVYEGDVLPEDFICPICKHGAVDFEPLK